MVTIADTSSDSNTDGTIGNGKGMKEIDQLGQPQPHRYKSPRPGDKHGLSPQYDTDPQKRQQMLHAEEKHQLEMAIANQKLQALLRAAAIPPTTAVPVAAAAASGYQVQDDESLLGELPSNLRTTVVTEFSGIEPLYINAIFKRSFEPLNTARLRKGGQFDRPEEVLAQDPLTGRLIQRRARGTMDECATPLIWFEAMVTMARLFHLFHSASCPIIMERILSFATVIVSFAHKYPWIGVLRNYALKQQTESLRIGYLHDEAWQQDHPALNALIAAGPIYESPASNGRNSTKKGNRRNDYPPPDGWCRTFSGPNGCRVTNCPHQHQEWCYNCGTKGHLKSHCRK